MKHVLVADDCESLLAAIKRCLTDAGFEVSTATNGADAVCLLGLSPPDLMLLDLAMPNMDGYAVLKRLGPSSPPVIVMTGDEGDFPAGVIAPMVKRVLKKPFDQIVLLEAIRSALCKKEDKDA